MSLSKGLFLLYLHHWVDSPIKSFFFMQALSNDWAFFVFIFKSFCQKVWIASI